MKNKIKELMTRLSEIPIVDENATLFEAILEIGLARSRHPASLRCPAALVVDSDKNVAGFLDFRNMLKGLQPGYGEVAESVEEGAIPPETIKAELQKFGLWEEALDALCKRSGETAVKLLMSVPDESQMAEGDASINEAIYRMVSTGKDYLFVKNGMAVTGVVCISDIMSHICDTVRACRI